MTVVAPAGTGKTRLTLELADWLRGEAQVLRGSCLPYGDGITFWPVAEIVRQAAAIDATTRTTSRAASSHSSCDARNPAR